MVGPMTIEVRGLERVLGWMEHLPPEVQSELIKTFGEAAEEIRDRAIGLAPVGVTGNLQQSIRVRKLRGLAVKVGPTARHRHVVIKGRRPGKIPPASRLRAWAALRGLAGKEFILARAIGTKGTKGHPFMRDAAAGADAMVRGRVVDAVRRVLARTVGR